MHHQECISPVASIVKFQRWVRIITSHILLLDKPNTGGQAEHQTCEKWQPLLTAVQVEYTEIPELSVGERKDKGKLVWLECCHVFKETRTANTWQLCSFTEEILAQSYY